jgi:hypothetical protein
MVEQAHEESEGPSIEDADVIVAGGRGLGARRTSSSCEELAQALGGAVAATRAVVDAAGTRTRRRSADRQDRSRRSCTVAVGISGAIQHKVGMQSSASSSRSTRRNAPIFEFADLASSATCTDRPQADRAREAAQVVSVEPADFRRRSSVREVDRRADGPADERIEVGVLIVGAGPAGLALRDSARAAARGRAARRDRLGDVPVAVLEKGKQPGSHLLSGAVVNPRRCARCSGTRSASATCRSTARSSTSRVYFLTRAARVRIPTPPTMKNHGNYVASLSQLGRWLAEQAEEAARRSCPRPRREAARRRTARARRAHRRQGAGRDGEELGELRAGLGRRRARHRPREGTQGHLTGVALDRFGLAARTRRSGRSA